MSSIRKSKCGEGSGVSCLPRQRNTVTTPEPVPYSWLSNYGFGGLEADFETAANSLNGKRDGAGKQLSVWQDYVAGTPRT